MASNAYEAGRIETRLRDIAKDAPSWNFFFPLHNRTRGKKRRGQHYRLASFLKKADVIIVTDRSTTMLCEAVSTGKPVYLALPDGWREQALKEIEKIRKSKRIGKALEKGDMNKVCRLIKNHVTGDQNASASLYHALFVLQGRAQILGNTAAEVKRQIDSPFIPPMTGDLGLFTRNVALAIFRRLGRNHPFTRLAPYKIYRERLGMGPRRTRQSPAPSQG